MQLRFLSIPLLSLAFGSLSGFGVSEVVAQNNLLLQSNVLSSQVAEWHALNSTEHPEEKGGNDSEADFRLVQNFFKQRYKIDITDTDFLPIYQFCVRWHGTPYAYGGTTRRAVDCSGLVGVAAKELFDVELVGGAGNIYERCEKVSKSDLKTGDMVFFAQGSYISHVGMYLKDGYFVHATSGGLGVVVSHLSEAYYNHRFLGGGRDHRIASVLPNIKSNWSEPNWDALAQQLDAKSASTPMEEFINTELTLLKNSNNRATNQPSEQELHRLAIQAEQNTPKLSGVVVRFQTNTLGQ